jgi:hypothetical protein
MGNLFRDFHAMAYQLARRTDPGQRYGNAAEYAKYMCALWIAFLSYFGMEIVARVVGIPLTDLLGRVRLVSDIVAVLMLVLSVIVCGYVIRISPTMQSPEDIRARFCGLSARRKVSVLALVVGSVTASLLY